MGRITKDNLSDELINEIEEIAGNATAELLNEAKALIANAVGEPLTAEDNFSKMSNDINNLTSDFKIGLMNGGVAVESTDRFQELILKMKEMINGDIDVDTALYESLKSILLTEGVEILEEDDMATLITKAGDKFTEKNTEIAARVLPAGTAVAGNVANGKTFINSTGKLITGTNTLNSRFATGTVQLKSNIGATTTTFSYSPGFTPSRLFVLIPYGKGGSYAGAYNFCVMNGQTVNLYDVGSYSGYIQISAFSATSFSIKTTSSITVNAGTLTWYAIA